MGTRLEGKNAVVTGAGVGIGREVALALAAEGAKVVVDDPGVARDGSGSAAAPANETVETIKSRGGVAVACYESVADFAAAERIIKTCIDNFGRIDILVNVAGILRDRMVFNMTEAEWDAVIDVHLKGTFNCIKFASIAMRAQKSGRIISFTSDAWRGTGTGQANYCAAKGGIVSLTRGVSREMHRYGVTCNAIAPVAATRMVLDPDVMASRQRRPEGGAASSEQAEETHSVPPGPEFIPPIVVYLATDYAADITGKVFGCSGGRITVYSEPDPFRGIYRDHEKDGAWTLDELIKLVPNIVAGLPTPETPFRF